MKRRTMFGLLAVPVVGLLAGATALAHGHGAPGWRSGMMKRMVSAGLDEALDAAKAAPEQRAAIHGTRERLFTTLEAEHQDHTAHRDQVLALFESDQVDAGQLQALRAEAQAHHQKIADAVTQAIVEIHDALAPEQRKIVADHVRRHARHGMR